MGICDCELPDGTRCTRQTVWNDMCEDCLDKLEGGCPITRRKLVDFQQVSAYNKTEFIQLINEHHLKGYQIHGKIERPRAANSKYGHWYSVMMVKYA